MSFLTGALGLVLILLQIIEVILKIKANHH